MSITLVTGQPGGGKTAKVVDMLAHEPLYQGRPLFVMGITDLQIEHQPCPVVDEWTEFRQSPEDPTLSLAYFAFPANAVIVIDEAQRVYRPRPSGSKVPPHVAAFETHRHTGVDFILITQHPGLLDANIRKLIGRHIHIKVTPFGRYSYEWPECGDPETRGSREIAARRRYVVPKRVFALYKSAEVHTVTKRAMPWYVYLFVGAVVSCIAAVWYTYRTIESKIAPAKGTQLVDGKVSSGSPAQGGGSGLTPEQYIKQQQPRVAGLLHTAPLYDDVTKPIDAPWPAGCFKSPKRGCQCFDQQGNKYKTTEMVCQQIIENGIFRAHAKPQEPVKMGPNGYPQGAGQGAPPGTLSPGLGAALASNQLAGGLPQ